MRIIEWVISGIIGAIIGAMLELFFAKLAIRLWKKSKLKLQSLRPTAFIVKKQNIVERKPLILGNYMTNFYLIDGDGILTYEQESLKIVYNEASQNLPWQICRLKRLIEEEIKKEKKSVWNGPLCALENYVIKRKGPKEDFLYLDLYLKKSDYYTFLATIESLDRPLSSSGETLRDVFLKPLEKRWKDGLVDKPLDPRLAQGFGVSLAIVTNDEKWILQQRALNMKVRPGELDTSVVESIHPEKDREIEGKNLNVFLTARRGIMEELAVTETEIAEITFLGFGVDWDYYQWNLLGFARLNCDSKDLPYKKSRGSAGAWETQKLLFLSFPAEIARHIKEKKIWSMGLATLYLAFVHEYGKKEVEKIFIPRL